MTLLHILDCAIYLICLITLIIQYEASKHAHFALQIDFFFTMQNIWGFCKPILFYKTKRERVSIDSKSWMLIEMKSKECKTCFTRLPKQHPMLSTCDLAEKCLNKFKKWNKNMSKNGTLVSCKTTSFTSEKSVRWGKGG